jgi:hypothetical protein
VAARYVVRNGPPGILHQLDPGDPAGDRQAIRLPHFRSGEQFHHWSAPARLAARSARRPNNIFAIAMKT